MLCLDNWVSFVSNVEAGIAHAVGSVMRKCSQNPRKAIATYFLVCFILATGFLQIEEETEGTELWVDVNSIPRQQLDVVASNFGIENRPFSLVVSLQDDSSGENIFVDQAFSELFDLHDAILSLQTSNGNGFEDLCVSAGPGVCLIDSPTAFWAGNSTLYEIDTAGPNPDDLIASTFVSPTYPNGFDVETDITFSNFELQNTVNGTRAFAIGFVARYFLVGEFGGSADELLEFESLVLDLVNDDFNFQTLDVHIQTIRSIDDELAASANEDFFLMTIAFTIMIGFAANTLGKPCSSLYGRTLVANVDVAIIMTGGLAAFGFQMYLGVPFQQLNLVLPFLLIGVGIDSAYVLTAGFDRSDPSKSLPDRLYDTGAGSGMSITVTTLTNAVALLFGSTTKLQAVEWFCYYAATSFIFVYFGHITAFAAVLTLDAERRNSLRADCCVCRKIPESKNESLNKESPLQKFFSDTYAPFLMRPLVKSVVIGVFVGAASIFGYLAATEITTEFDLSLLTTDTSYLRFYYEKAEELFGSADAGRVPTSLFVGQVNYSEYETQAEIRRLVDVLLSQPTVDESLGAEDWHLDFTAWANDTNGGNYSQFFSEDGKYLVGATFIPALQEFLAEFVFQRFQDDIVFSTTDPDVIIMSRISVQHVLLPNAEISVDALLETQSVTEDSTLEPSPFVVSFAYQFYDQFRIIVPEVVTSLSFALVAVLVICTVFLVHPLSVLILIIVLAMILTNLLGSLPIWPLDLNSVTSINLVMALGLVIDYSAHILHHFGSLDHNLSRNERALKTLSEMGPPVFMGVCTTFLGVCPLAFSSSEIFIAFFKMFLSIVIVGGTHGLIFLPVLLSLVGPSVPRDVEGSKKLVV
mmetsp:Transcript_13997/g.18319  ORF Transcript_13997/g.18319 Transcript_13997/m.18319 type:complete len:865 (+) Transcript_13997:168-2762(+)